MRERVSCARAALVVGIVAALWGLLSMGTSDSAWAASAAVDAAPAELSASIAGSSSALDDIRDIRGPKWILPVWLIPAVLAAAALIVLAVFGAWRWHRRRRRPRPLLPFELALQRLTGTRVLMKPSGAKEFSVAVSGILRGYIEQQFEVTATLRTTEEFLHDLLESSNTSLVSHRALLSEFLHQCDLAKFAGMTLTLQSMESLYQSACVFVTETGQPSQAAEVSAESRPSIKAHDSIPST